MGSKKKFVKQHMWSITTIFTKHNFKKNVPKMTAMAMNTHSAERSTKLCEEMNELSEVVDMKKKDSEGNVRECYSTVLEEYNTYVCTCKGDNCNGSNTLGISIISCTLSVILAVFFK